MAPTSPEKKKQIEALLIQGKSYRYIQDTLRCSFQIIQPIRDRLLISGVKFNRCECGRRAGHKGMCEPRIRRAKERNQ